MSPPQASAYSSDLQPSRGAGGRASIFQTLTINGDELTGLRTAVVAVPQMPPRHDVTERSTWCIP